MKKQGMLYKLASGMALVASFVVLPASWILMHQGNTPKELLKK